MSDVDLSKLRTPFSADLVGKLPRVTCGDCSDRNKQCSQHSKVKCGICQAYVSEKHIHIDYVGHADVTDRLLSVDPEWNWEPKAEDEHGLPVFDNDRNGSPVGLWIKLTVGGVTRLGYGSCPSGQGDAVKVLIGDALRNAAMRFGVALDLWAKGDRADPTAENATALAGQAAKRGTGQSAGDTFDQAAPAPPRQNRKDAPRGEPIRSVQPADEPDPWDGKGLDWALEYAATLKDGEAAGRLWREAAAKGHAKELTPADVRTIQDLLNARADGIRKFEDALKRLKDPQWADRLKDISDVDEARTVLADAGQVRNAAKGHLIREAVAALWPGAIEETEVAA